MTDGLATEPRLLAWVLAPLLLVIGIGLWSYRRTKSNRDFFLAGQRVGLLATGLATMAAAFSGFVFLGGPGLTYSLGLSSLAIVLPVGFTAGLLCWTLAKRLRLLAEVRDIYTIPDAIAARFASRWATGLAAVAVFVGVVGYLAAQFLALAILLESLFGLRQGLGWASLPVALAIGWGTVLLYSLLGGMVAGIYTDILQGLLMLMAALVVSLRVVWVGGGVRQLVTSVAGSQEFSGFFEPLGGLAPATLGFFLVFGIGVLGQPQMLHKFYMMKDPRQLRWLPLVLAASQALCLLIWIGLGVGVPALVAEGRMAPLAHPDSAAPRFLLEFGTPALTGLVVAAVVAAVMSTADSLLNIGSAALVRDLPRLLGRRVEETLGRARWATVGIAALAAGLAWSYDDLVALLGTFAFGTLGASLAPVLAVGLNWKRVTAGAAIAAMATGLGMSLGLEAVRRLSPAGTLEEIGMAAGTLPAAVALMASFTVLLATSWWWGDEQGTDIADDVVTVMES